MAPAFTTTHLERPPLQVTLGEIDAAVQAGVVSGVASEWTADAARAAGDGRELLTVARILADRVRSTVTYAHDTYGGEVVQSIEETLVTRRAGDCDDFTSAFAALAARAGLRTGVAVFYGEDDAPLHILPVVEDPGQEGRWIPFELTVRVPFGTYPDMDQAGAWQVTELAASSPTGLGFIGALVSGVLGFFGAKSVAKSNKRAAEALVTAENLKADAARDVAASQREAQREALEAAERIASGQAAARAQLVRNVTDQVSGLVRVSLPFVLGIAALSAVGTVAAASRAPKARKR